MHDIDLEVYDSEFASSIPVKLKSICISEEEAVDAIEFLEKKLAALNQNSAYDWHCCLLKNSSGDTYHGRLIIKFGPYLAVAVPKGRSINDSSNWSFMSLDGKTRFSRKDILSAIATMVDDGNILVVGPISAGTYIAIDSIESLLIESALAKGTV